MLDAINESDGSSSPQVQKEKDETYEIRVAFPFLVFHLCLGDPFQKLRGNLIHDWAMHLRRIRQGARYSQSAHPEVRIFHMTSETGKTIHLHATHNILEFELPYSRYIFC